jgi:hypothetical protein
VAAASAAVAAALIKNVRLSIEPSKFGLMSAARRLGRAV